MAKRGYKLRNVEEFIAHTSNVNCLKIGTKSSRLLLSGGEDHKVNLWAIGRATSLLSLSGHTSPVESVTFDSAEVLAVSGASSGAVKLWDLEEAKILRTITGHRANCTSVEFHPFGEFFASGSLDANLKIWDIRRKGCIHTYKGHTDGINTIRFTPDGRWVVSGGGDNVVKLWDLTAGKLLHDFKFHEGQINCIDFHPHEFLLATGSADRTVKFWDLETFELIGSAGPEATKVRSMVFHPDGRTLFCGLEDSFKVLSWEPIRFHDAVDMGWSTLADLSIHEGKLLGCSYHRSCVGVWVADISLIAPYAAGARPKHMEPKVNLEETQSVQHPAMERSRSGARRMEMPYSSKEIHASSTTFSIRSNTMSTPKKNNIIEVHTSDKNSATSKHAVTPVIVPRSNSVKTEKAFDFRKETASPVGTVPSVVLSKPTLSRKPSNVSEDSQMGMLGTNCGPANGKPSDSTTSLSFTFFPRDISSRGNEGQDNSARAAAEKMEKVLSLEQSPSIPSESVQQLHTPRQDNVEPKSGTSELLNSGRSTSSLRYVKGVAVQPGRTRSLVERWEKRDRSMSSEALSDIIQQADILPSTKNEHHQISEKASATSLEEDITPTLMQNHDHFVDVLQSRLTKLQVVRNFWERNDIKGSINAVRRLPDHAVQADVISVLYEKTDMVTLDLFSCLLPLLTGLLDSKVDRFMGISLDVLLKLVKVFGPLIYSTISASSPVGVDIEAEQRFERCSQCFTHLQKLKQILPSLTRRGGSLAKSAMELNLVLES